MIHPESQKILNQIAPVPEHLLLDPPQVSFRYNDLDRGVLKNTDLYFLNVDRMPFDEWLLGHMPDNVTVRAATTYLGHETLPDGRLRARLRQRDTDTDTADDFTVTCDFLVGADGTRSAVRAALGIAPFARYITLQDYCQRTGPLDPVFDCFHFSGIPQFGIGYIIPKSERVLVGLVYYPGTKAAHRLQDKALARLRESLPIGPLIKREAWIAPKIEKRSDVACGHGAVLLAGEAGGFISPTSGEGISWALISGQAAGQAIATHQTPSQVAQAYRQATTRLSQDIARRLRWFPAMNSRLGKTLAGYVPTPIISHFTHKL